MNLHSLLNFLRLILHIKVMYLKLSLLNTLNLLFNLSLILNFSFSWVILFPVCGGGRVWCECRALWGRIRLCVNRLYVLITRSVDHLSDMLSIGWVTIFPLSNLWISQIHVLLVGHIQPLVSLSYSIGNDLSTLKV